MNQSSVTAAVLTHNEAHMVDKCLRTVSWCDAILVLDRESNDGTPEKAKKFGARVISDSERSFAQRRQRLAQSCQTDWILYIDADERVTPALAEQLKQTMANPETSAIAIPRKNFFFGQLFNHGGWQGEYVTRAFRLSQLKSWQGTIHESPEYAGQTVQLHEPLWHFSHRSVRDGLRKTADWTPMEAELLFQAGISPVTVWTVLRKGLGEVWRRGILNAGWKDGRAGLMEVITQAINRMLVYMQVWELQQQHIPEQYQNLEEEIEQQWQNAA